MLKIDCLFTVQYSSWRRLWEWFNRNKLEILTWELFREDYALSLSIFNSWLLADSRTIEVAGMLDTNWQLIGTMKTVHPCVMCCAVRVCLLNCVKEGEVSGRQRQKRFRVPRSQCCWAELTDMSCEWRFLWCSILVTSSDSTRIRRVTDSIYKDSSHELDLAEDNDYGAETSLPD